MLDLRDAGWKVIYGCPAITPSLHEVMRGEPIGKAAIAQFQQIMIAAVTENGKWRLRGRGSSLFRRPVM